MELPEGTIPFQALEYAEPQDPRIPRSTARAPCLAVSQQFLKASLQARRFYRSLINIHVSRRCYVCPVCSGVRDLEPLLAVRWAVP